MRKFSRRTTIFMVALGVLLAASLALAAVLATGTTTFTVHTEGESQPLGLDVAVTPVDEGPISRDDHQHFTLTVTNNNDVPVDLGVPGEEGTEGTPAVSFEVDAPAGLDCGLEDLELGSLPAWDDQTLPPGESLTDNFSVGLTEGASEACDGIDLDITVTVSGVVADEGDEAGEAVTGTGSL